MAWFPDLVGLVGVILILIAYYLLQAEKILCFGFRILKIKRHWIGTFVIFIMLQLESILRYY